MKLFDYVFCDDIRAERNNKLSLMGVFNDRIVIKPQAAHIKWPLPIRLCTLIRISIERNQEWPDEFVFEYMVNGKPLQPIQGRIGADPNQTVLVISIVGQGIPIERGSMGFKLNIKKGGAIMKEFNLSDALRVIEEQTVAEAGPQL